MHMTNTATTNRTNRYPGTCSLCGTHVPAESGTLGPKVNGRWTVQCSQGCAPAVQAAVDASDLPGFAELVSLGTSVDAFAFGRGAAYAETRMANDDQWVGYVGTLLLEEGGIMAAWSAHAEHCEWWDGEPEHRASAAGCFVATLPAAVAQNVAIHGVAF